MTKRRIKCYRKWSLPHWELTPICGSGNQFERGWTERRDGRIADSAVRESRERVTSAIKNSGYMSWPKLNDHQFGAADIRNRRKVRVTICQLPSVLRWPMAKFPKRGCMITSSSVNWRWMAPCVGAACFHRVDGSPNGHERIAGATENVQKPRWSARIGRFPIDNLRQAVDFWTAWKKSRRTTSISTKFLSRHYPGRFCGCEKGQEHVKRALKLRQRWTQHYNGYPPARKTMLINAFPPFYRRSLWKKRWKPPKSTPLPDCWKTTLQWLPPARSVHRTTPSAMPG